MLRLVFLFLSGVSVAVAPPIKTAAATDPAGAEDRVIIAGPTGRFEFHLDPLVSLHHFAFHLAKDAERERRLRGRVPIRPLDRQLMTAQFREVLGPLVEAYAPYIDQSLLFDEALFDLGQAVRMDRAALADQAVADALEGAMPAYLEAYWPSHRAAALASLTPTLALLERHGEAVAAELAASLESRWPDAPLRVDLVPYANWAGAFTGDNVITISALDPEAGGSHTFEILFHEAMHTRPLDGDLRERVNTALELRGVDDARAWHDVQFFISGEIVARHLRAEGYQMYVEHTSLRERSEAEYAIIEDAINQTSDLTRRIELIADGLAELHAAN